MSRDDVAAAFTLAAVVGQLIQMKGSISSGELYAILNGRGIGIGNHLSILDILKRAGLIKVEHHWITWIGPAAQ